MLLAFMGIGPQELIIVSLIFLCTLLPAIVAVAIVGILIATSARRKP